MVLIEQHVIRPQLLAINSLLKILALIVGC